MREKTYLIADKKYHIIKIGRAKNPYKHLKTIQKKTSSELEMVYVFEDDIEKEIKELLKNYKIRGEWYYPNPKVMHEIQAKFLPNDKELVSFINDLFGNIKMREQLTCLCWVDDEETKCQHMRHKGSLKTCETYEIWKACVRKEEIDFGD